MAIKVQGTTEPIELAQERTWNPSRGWQTSRKWVGPHAAITALAAQIQFELGRFVQMSVTPQEAGTATLTVTHDDLQDGDTPEAASNGEPEADQDSWTLNGNDYEKDIWSHPAIAALATNAKNDYDWLRKNLPAAQKNGTWQDVLDVWDTAFSWDDSAATKSIFKMFRDGIEAYSVSQFVLRRSRSIKSRAQGTVSVSNVGRQFTLTQLQTIEGLPATLRFATPSTGTWIKRTPTVNFDANKLTVENEYWHAGDWHPTLYPTV